MNNCNKCNNSISSPALTGELCTKCYFKSRNESKIQVQEEVSKAPEGRLGNETEINTGITSASEIAGEFANSKEYDIKKEHHPNVDKQSPVNGIKYCQSCIERGYGLVKATREFRPGEFICDDCFEPLLQNTLGYSVERAEIERVIPNVDYEKPLLNQFYNLLNIPLEIRFSKSEQVLNSRNQIFNYHAIALANRSAEEIAAEIEQLQVMLFQIKISLEPLTDYINKVKAEKRQAANLESIKKGKKEVEKGPSKAKLSKDEKMAKALGMTLEKYLEMAKAARVTEFNKLTGN